MGNRQRAVLSIHVLAGLVLSLGTPACAPKALELEPTAGTQLKIGGAVRELESLTDLDRVRDVESGGGHVYVATDRGVLVYGEGDEPKP